MDGTHTAHLLQIAKSFGDIRDSLLRISLALTDLVTETPSSERDEVLATVEHYLDRLRQSGPTRLD